MNFAKTMKTKSPQWFALLASAPLLLAANGHGQVPPAPTPPPPPFVEPTTGLPVPTSRSQASRFNVAIENKRVEVTFENLQLTEVVIWLEKTFPEVNFVLPQRLAELNPVVTLRLRAAGLRDILEAIDIATDGMVESEVRSPTLVALRARPEPRSVAPAFSGQALPGAAPAALPADSESNGWQRYGVGMPAMAAEAPPTCQVLNLREVLRVNDPKRIRETLQEAEKITRQTLEIMAADSPQPRRRQPIQSFEYHEGSGVLVIIGRPDAIKVAMDVIRNMRLQDAGGGGRSGALEKSAEPK